MFYGWWVVLAAVGLIVLSHGVRLSFGVYLIPLSREFGWTRATTAGVFSLYMVVYAIVSPLLGMLADRYGPRAIGAAGAFLLGSGLIVASSTSTAWHVYLGYSALTAVGSAAMFVPSLGAVGKFFSKRRGLALGLAMTGTGLGPFISNPVSQYLVASFDWRRSFLLTGLVVIAIGVPLAAIIMRRSPEDIGLLPDGERAKEPGNVPSIGPSRTGPAAPKLGEILSTRVFWLTSPCFLVSGILLMVISTHLVAYATDAGIEKMVAAAALGGLSLVSVVGRISWGAMGDRVGRRYTLLAISFVQALTLLWLVKATSPAMLWAWVVVYGFFYGGWGPNLLGIMGDLFGRTAMATMIGVANISLGIGGAVGPWLAGYIFDTQGSYNQAFLLFAFLAFLTMGCIFFLRPRKGAPAPDNR